jgi:hypothetical protein
MANFDPLNTEWELYNIDEDPIQQVNVADKYPKKSKNWKNCSGKRRTSTMSTLSAVLWAGHCSRNPIRSGLEKDIGN